MVMGRRVPDAKVAAEDDPVLITGAVAAEMVAVVVMNEELAAEDDPVLIPGAVAAEMDAVEVMNEELPAEDDPVLTPGAMAAEMDAVEIRNDEWAAEDVPVLIPGAVAAEMSIGAVAVVEESVIADTVTYNGVVAVMVDRDDVWLSVSGVHIGTGTADVVVESVTLVLSIPDEDEDVVVMVKELVDAGVFGCGSGDDVADDSLLDDGGEVTGSRWRPKVGCCSPSDTPVRPYLTCTTLA